MSNLQALDLGFLPRHHQQNAHERRQRMSILVWHRRSGKTVYACIELILSALTYRLERGRFAYIAPFYRQAKTIAWDYVKAFSRAIPGAVILEAELAVRYPNGAEVRLYGADNPDALRGIYLDGLVLDEVADMRSEIWGEILLPTLADRAGWVLMIGTPKGQNVFSELYHKALVDPEWFADLQRASDTGAIPAEEIERLRHEMSEAQWAQEMECDFSASNESVIIPLDQALEARARNVSRFELEGMPKILGVDVARSPKGDRSAIVMRQGKVVWEPIVFRGMDLMELSSHVVNVYEKHRVAQVFVDVGGIGAGVVDRLRQLGVRVVGVDFGGTKFAPWIGEERCVNYRAAMWKRMADWTLTGSLPASPELISDLTALTFNRRNAAGHYAIESKDAFKERTSFPSPDTADALALTFAETVPRDISDMAAALLPDFTRAGQDYQPQLG